jgi:hypothetical protein
MKLIVNKFKSKDAQPTQTLGPVRRVAASNRHWHHHQECKPKIHLRFNRTNLLKL